MLHPIHEKHAQLLVGYCLEVQPGQNVRIETSTAGEQLARALVREVLRAGGVPHLRLSYPELLEDILELASDSYFGTEPVIDIAEAEAVDATIYALAAHNTRSRQGADKDRYVQHVRRSQPVRRVFQERGTTWTLTLHPTEATAQDAGLSLDAFAHQVYDAMFLFDADPAARWGEVRARQARLIELLAQADVVRIVADDTDLELRVRGRTWRNSDGRTNMPSGEIYTAPVEDSANGHIRFGVRSSVNGVEVRDIRLTFVDGEVVRAEAATGDDLLQAQLGIDRGARYLGELGIGTNENIRAATGNILLDEKIGGTVHLALGASIPGTGGMNDSAIHWDMICDLREGGTLFVDGEPFIKDGRITAG